MDLSEKSAFLKIASSVAKAAGERLSAIAERRVNSDAGNDVKLQEDVESEMFIRGKLETTGIPVIGEENGGDTSLAFNDSYYWIVDPIDGTYNFLRGIPGVCVSVALMKGAHAGCRRDKRLHPRRALRRRQRPSPYAKRRGNKTRLGARTVAGSANDGLPERDRLFRRKP